MTQLALTIDTLRDAIFSLRMTAECLDEVAKDPHYRKWVIIALHNALQGFMVNALRITDDSTVLRSTDSPAWLIEFNTLYKRIKKPDFMEHSLDGKAFRPEGTQDESVRRLHNELRNTFMHFTPKFSLSFCWEYVPVVRDVTKVISFLDFDSENVLWLGDDDPQSQTKNLIERIMARLNELQEVYTVEMQERLPSDPTIEQWAAELMGGTESSGKE
jgi:hypothetical protein